MTPGTLYLVPAPLDFGCDSQVALDRAMPAATLEVAASNGAALALYGRCGFSTAGIRRGYYRNGDDALVQWRRLHDAQEVRIAAHS